MPIGRGVFSAHAAADAFGIEGLHDLLAQFDAFRKEAEQISDIALGIVQLLRHNFLERLELLEHAHLDRVRASHGGGHAPELDHVHRRL